MRRFHEQRSGPVSIGEVRGHSSPVTLEARVTFDSEGMRRAAFHCRYRSSGLALEIGVSERHLRRLFADYLGCSPQTWLREERLQLARQMLATRTSVKEVAYELAYTQLSQFCRDFKRRFGHSPSAERASRRTERYGFHPPRSPNLPINLPI